MSRLRVRLASDPASVPGARRFVSDGLTSWGLHDLVDDVALCVTELAANAALHSAASFMSVSLSAEQRGVRVGVEDDGAVPRVAVAPRADYDDPDGLHEEVPLEDEPTTGRVLAIVDLLATSWGVEDTPRGKEVWARFGTDSEALVPMAVPGTVSSDEVLLPEGWSLVTLAGCPVRLSLRQDEHLDELVREMQLLAADPGNTHSRSLVAQIEGLLFGPAHARFTGRQQAVLAERAGHTHVDVQMALPPEAGMMVHQLQNAVAAADRLCEEMQLLTLASSPDLRALRAWMTEEIIGQSEHGRTPVTWEDWLRSRAS